MQPEQPSADTGERAKGLLDRLEAGHFRGVAAVRLSINFFDELQARAASRSASAIAQNTGPLADATDAGLQGVIDSLSLDESTATTLRNLGSDFRETLGTILGGGGTDPASLDQRIGAAFEQFVGSLRDALAPAPTPAPEPARGPAPSPSPTDAPSPGSPVDQPVVAAQVPTVAAPAPTPTTDPVDPTVEPQPAPTVPAPSLDDAITSFSEAFAGALSTFLGAVREAGSLPEPTAPRGHGGAYQRFLTIYNSLRQPATPALDEAA